MLNERSPIRGEIPVFLERHKLEDLNFHKKEQIYVREEKKDSFGVVYFN
jgi:hypothetical protein